MAKRKKRPSRGHVTAPSRSLVDRHAFRRVKAADPVVTFHKTIRRQPDLRLVEDLRHVPKDLAGRQDFASRSGRPAVVKRNVEDNSELRRSRLSVPMHDYFQDPQNAVVCIRRHVRKRVLFALRKVGKGKAVSPVRHFTDKSFVRCK